MATFISYSRTNSDFAVQLAKDLKAAGFDIWLDQLDIPTGARWDDEIEKALAKSEIFLIILSPDSIESQNVKDEIGLAIDSGKHILPVMKTRCNIPLRLRRFQYVDFTNKPYEESLGQIKHLLSNTKELAAKDNVDSKIRPAPPPSPQPKPAAPTKPMPKTGLWALLAVLLCIFAIAGSAVVVFALPRPNFLFPAAPTTIEPSSPPVLVATTVVPPTSPNIITTDAPVQPNPTTVTPSLTSTSTLTPTETVTLTPPPAAAFSASSPWQGYFCLGNETCGVGDFNGDGKDDIVTFTASYTVYVALSNGNGFNNANVWHNYFCAPPEVCTTGDVNGDGLDDVINFIHSTRNTDDGRYVYVALSNGTSFGPSIAWHNVFCLGGESCGVGDFNGDRRADIITFLPSYYGFTAFSNGTSFGSSFNWPNGFCAPPEVCMTGDVNGDGLDDVINFIHSTRNTDDAGYIYVALSNGNGFGASTAWHNIFCIGQETCGVGDFNGDGREDVITFLPSKELFYALSNGAGFNSSVYWNQYVCAPPDVCMVGDVNGDGKADVIDFVHDARGGADHAYVYVAISNIK